MLTRLRQIAAKIEGTEGTAETLAAADAKLLVYEPKYNPTVENYMRQPARASLSKLTGLRGSKTAGITFGLELRGSGSADTAPEWSKLLKACGFTEQSDIVKIPVTSLASGPYVHGETVTGGNSSAEGRVINQLSADGDLWLEIISGTFQAVETLTGGTSGATSTSGTPVTTAGILWRPMSGDSVDSLTMAGYFDGIHHKIAGARGNVGFQCSLNEPVMMNFEFMGKIVETTDVAMLSVTHETAVPPTFLNVGLELPGGYAACFTQLELNMNNDVVARACASEAAGVQSYRITGRSPEGTINPEQVLVATHDFYNKLYDGDEGYMEFDVGSVAGNRFKFIVPAIQYDAVSDDDLEGRAIAGLTLSLNEDNLDQQDEIEILQY